MLALGLYQGVRSCYSAANCALTYPPWCRFMLDHSFTPFLFLYDYYSGGERSGLVSCCPLDLDTVLARFDAVFGGIKRSAA